MELQNYESQINIELSEQLRKVKRELQKTDTILQVLRKLHAEIDVNSVISEVISSLQAMYPGETIDIFLSQSIQHSNQAVKLLDLEAEDNLCSQAIMEGEILTQMSESGSGIIAVPLSGKQGDYGVIQLTFSEGQLDSNELMLISAIAGSAGIAFENARHYELSNMMINELRLINEITRKLNRSLQLQDILDYASRELIAIFDGHYCFILKMNAAKDRLVIQSSNDPFYENGFISTDDEFSKFICNASQPIIVTDFHHKGIESRLMSETESHSLMTSPILINHEVVGVIMITHREPGFFSFSNYKLLQAISEHISLAIMNASLHAEVKRMVITDNLTGLYVRSYLDEQIELMQKKDYCGTLILLDIDYFKQINDKFGHQVGDRVIIQVSEIIKSSIREQDVAARWGGEEFAIYLAQSTLEQTIKVSDRIRYRIHQETNPQVTVSCGVSQWNWEDSVVGVEDLFYRADMALYEAKNKGRNRIVLG